MRLARVAIMSVVVFVLLCLPADASSIDIGGELQPGETHSYGQITVLGPWHEVRVHVYWSSNFPTCVTVRLQECGGGNYDQVSSNEGWLNHTFVGMSAGTYCVLIINCGRDTLWYGGWVIW